MKKLALVSILSVCFSSPFALSYDSAQAIAYCTAEAGKELQSVVIYRDRDTSIENGSGFLQITTSSSKFGSVHSVQLSVRVDHEAGTADISVPTHAIELKGMSRTQAVRITVSKPVTNVETVLTCKSL